MSELFWLSDAQMERLKPFFPKSRGKPRVDDRRVLSGIILIQRNGLMWKHAPKDYGPPKTLYNRWKRWSCMPAILVGGFTGTVNGFIDNLAAYNSSGAVANLPKHLIGFQKLFSLVGVSLPSLPIILGSVVGIVAAWAIGIKELHLLQITTLLAILASGLQTYDLSLALCLLPFLSLGFAAGASRFSR